MLVLSVPQIEQRENFQVDNRNSWKLIDRYADVDFHFNSVVSMNTENNIHIYIILKIIFDRLK
jgi:hypothetical protein